MIYRMTSYKRIIAKLFRDLKIFDANHIEDSIEWVAEAAEAIGYFGQTKNITGYEITVTGHKGELPCDLILLNGVSYGGNYLPYGTGRFNYSTSVTSDVAQSLTGMKNTFKIEPGYIKTKEKECTVYIDYEAYHRDSDGLPMIPDVFSFKDAVAKYITMKLIMLGYKHPVLSYEKAEQEWYAARMAAHNKAHIPDAPSMEAFVSNWVRLVPHISPELQFNENLNDRELIE